MNYFPLLHELMEAHEKEYIHEGDYSVTELIDPPRLVQLARRHKDKVPVDVKRSLPSFIGSGIHFYIEHLLRPMEQYMTEVRVRATVHDRLITGKFDILKEANWLYDAKSCKTWKLIKDPEHKDWEKQLNLYAYMIKHDMGFQIDRATVAAFVLDWIEGKAERDASYPQEPALEIEIPLWSEEEQRAFLYERVELHKKAESMSDEELYLCDSDERWDEDLAFAIYKTPSHQRATRVLKTREEAAEVSRQIKGISSASVLEIRHPRRKRCERYCPAREVCSQWQDFKDSPKTERVPVDILWR